MRIFRQLFDTETSTYTYLLGDSHSKEAVIIDPVVTQVERDTQLIKELGLTLKYSVDTHVHADHVSGSGELRKRLHCKVGLSAKSGAEGMDLGLKEGDEIRFGEYRLKVLETAGHTNGCLSYLQDERVFTGDALFVRGCGRTDFQEGNAGTLYDNVVGKIFSLPDDTLIYPGHDYKGQTCTSVREEKHFNPRLTKDRQGFIEFMKNLKLAEPAKLKVAVPLNLRCGNAE